MKHSNFVLVAIAFVLSIAITSCNKNEIEQKDPKITNENVTVTSTSATFTWTVDWAGKRISVVELSENEDMSHSQFYGSEEELNKTEYIVTANNLQPATKYYYRFWVWNQNYVNNKFVMETKWFTTDSDLPKVTTLPVSEVTWTTALAGGNVTDDCGSEVTERGVSWAENPNPTISGQHLANGSGTGNFTVLIENLEPDKTYYVRAYAKNANGISYGEDESFITNETLLPEVTTAEVTEIDWRTAVGGGEVTNENGAVVTERGVCWSTEHNPDIYNGHANNGTGLGTFSVNITGLTAGTAYFARAYAKNSAGVKYGNEVSFTTLDPIAPTVTTTAVTSISYTTATGGGNVTSDGGSYVSQRGICWSKEHNPVYEGVHLAVGTGTGSFTGQMTGLDDGTTYYVRAYALNGVDVSYGEERSFTTQTIVKPSVTTVSVTEVEWTTAKAKGSVSFNGGSDVIEQGVCWNTSGNPTINDNHVAGSLNSTTYTINLSGLNPGTSYYLKAYAKNQKGLVGYGDVKVFTTKELVVPSVTTNDVTLIKQRSAKGNGKVTSDGGLAVTEKGFCWGLEQNPDFENSHVVSSSTGTSFNAFMEGLEPNTTYYVRAYAKNEKGTGWGGNKTFTTLPIQAPSLSITNVVHNHISATISCEIYNTGGADIIERGVCWGTNPNQMPTIDGEHISIEGGDNNFQIEITGLEPNTNYYVRAYAKNNGIDEPGYSSFTTFKTYPEWWDKFVDPAWICNFTENGHDCEIEFFVYGNNNEEITFMFMIEDDAYWGIDAEGLYEVDGDRIVADYDEVEVYIDDNFTPGSMHGFTHGIPITVSYQVISCTMSELVIKESLENKTWHLYPDKSGKHKSSKNRKNRVAE